MNLCSCKSKWMSSRNLEQYKVYNPLSVTVMDRDNSSVTDSGISGGMPSTHSSQQLMPSDISPSASVSAPRSGITKMQWFTVIVLCFVNLINYMDRFTIAGKFLWPLKMKNSKRKSRKTCSINHVMELEGSYDVESNSNALGRLIWLISFEL